MRNDSSAAAEDRSAVADHGAQNLDLDGSRPSRRSGVCGGASDADERDSATLLSSIGWVCELQALLLRPPWQAVQGGSQRDLTENVSAPRINATFGHSGELWGNIHGNENLGGGRPLFKLSIFPQLTCSKSFGEKSGLNAILFT
jgi:hypothetical protein